MRKLLTLLLTIFTISVQAQTTTDTQLKTSLQEYIDLTRQMEFDKLMDYVHPKLFTIVPKQTMVQTLKQAFESKEMTFSFDSMAIASIGPVFTFNSTAYRKVNYYMSLRITLPDSTDLGNAELAEYMEISFQAGFPGKKITIDEKNNAIKVAGTEMMFAIKDKGIADWKFLATDKSNPQLIRALYPKQVRDHFKIL